MGYSDRILVPFNYNARRVDRQSLRFALQSLITSFHSVSVYKIWRGPLHEEDTAEVEWVFRPYMNTAYKRRYLSTEANSDNEGEDQTSEENAAGGTKRSKAGL